MKTKHCLAPLLSSDWRCPGCGTPVSDCERDIVLHHDHLENEFFDLASALDARRSKPLRNFTIQDAGYIEFVLAHRRFAPVPICSRCNARDGHNLKIKNGAHDRFSFSIEQLRSLDHSSDENARKASAVQAWKLFEKEFHAHLFSARKAWYAAARHYVPDRDFKYPAREPLRFKGLETVVTTLTYDNSSWVCQDALETIRNTYWLTPSDALRRSFEKRRLYNTGKQKFPQGLGVKRILN